jgi:hypothetical protein
LSNGDEPLADQETWTEFIRASLLKNCGYFEKPKGKMPELKELYASEWCEEFVILMRNRMVMGAFRYGRLKAPGKPQFDRLSSILERLKLYEETGNLEILVDVANLCLLEFVEGEHPKRHWKAVDDGTHAERKGAEK